MTLNNYPEDELIAELISSVKGLTNDQIYEVVAEARRKITVFTGQEQQGFFRDLFERRNEKLEALGCPQAILKKLSRKKEDVLAKTYEMQNGEGSNISFLPVIPRSYMGIYSLMQMVRIGDNVGWTSLIPQNFTDVVKTPEEPYYILDVDKGTEMRGNSSDDAEKIIKSQKRSCLTIDEAIAVGIHNEEVLANHEILAVGSLYRDEHELTVPVIYLDESGVRLFFYSHDYAHFRYAYPSCASRI